MTHHKAVDSVRKEENLRRRRTTADVLEERESDQPRVDEQVWASVRRERVRAALADLPAAQREALGLAYYGGYTQREIAGLTATPLGTVKTRMLMGMRRLRDNLDEVGAHGDSPDPHSDAHPVPRTDPPIPSTPPTPRDLPGGAP